MSIRLFVALIYAMILSGANVIAQEQAKRNALIESCRAINSLDPKNATPIQGECSGIVSTLLHFGTARLSICAPQGTTVEQARKAVIDYFDQQPQSRHLDFRDIALNAMQRAWPCLRD